MLQQMPEFIGFLTSLGINPKKYPLIPNSLKYLVATVIPDSFPLLRLIWLLSTSKGCETVIAIMPAINAGMNVSSLLSLNLKKSSLR